MSDCLFCRIAQQYQPNLFTADEKIPPPAHVVLSTPTCLAFLDILPLSHGHLFVTIRQHREMISDVTEEESRELGAWISIVSRALANLTEVWDWNIVQNNGAAAAQVMKHVHFHIILRPALPPEQRNKNFTMFVNGRRSKLDLNKARIMVKNLRAELEREAKSKKLLKP